MNIQVGSAASSPQINPTAVTDGRANLAVPTDAENQATNSFSPVSQNEESANAQDKQRRQATAEKQEQQRAQSDQARSEREASNTQENAQEEGQRAEARNESRQQEQARSESQTEANRQEGQQEQRRLEQELKEIRQLADRDREVRAHEQAHQAVGGQYAGAMSLAYETGPDGKRYAVSGEVSISIGKVPNDPSATLEKAQTVRRAALAPAEPSAQDRQVAAQAVQIALEARSELQQLRQEELQNESASREQREAKEESDESRLAREEETQQGDQQQEQRNNEAAVNLQELNERLARVQSQLVEAGQIGDKVNSKVNLLDVTA